MLNLEEENFNKSFARLIDDDENGIISKKEMSNFQVCDKYNGKKIQESFKNFGGKKADLN